MDAAPTLTDYRPFLATDRYGFQPTNYLLTPDRRYGSVVNAEQAIGGDTKLSAKIFATPHQRRPRHYSQRIGTFRRPTPCPAYSSTPGRL